MNNFFLCLEDYLTYSNPNHFFNSLFHKKKNNIKYELISIFFILIFSLLYIDINIDFKKIIGTSINVLNVNTSNINQYFDKKKYLILCFKNGTNYTEINEKSPFIIFNLLKLIFIFVLNIIILLLYIILIFKIKKIIFRAREKLLRNLKIKIV